MQFALALLTLVSGSGQKGLSASEVQSRFDQAMRNNDGKAFYSVMREREVKGLSADQCRKFLDRFVKPWLNAPSMQRASSGALLRLNDPNCRLVI